jgi:hypothetical protein
MDEKAAQTILRGLCIFLKSRLSLGKGRFGKGTGVPKSFGIVGGFSP